MDLLDGEKDFSNLHFEQWTQHGHANFSTPTRWVSMVQSRKNLHTITSQQSRNTHTLHNTDMALEF